MSATKTSVGLFKRADVSLQAEKGILSTYCDGGFF
jgi:hypothetical protein